MPRIELFVCSEYLLKRGGGDDRRSAPRIHRLAAHPVAILPADTEPDQAPCTTEKEVIVPTIRLYRYELEMLPEYSCTMPSGTTDWKTWRCDENFGTGRPESWIVGQYVPHEDPTKIRVRAFSIEFLEGPAPLRYTDWTKIGPHLWVSFEHDIRREHDVRKFHAVQLFVGDDPDHGIADEFVRVTQDKPQFRDLCDAMQAALKT